MYGSPLVNCLPNFRWQNQPQRTHKAQASKAAHCGALPLLMELVEVHPQPQSQINVAEMTPPQRQSYSDTSELLENVPIIPDEHDRKKTEGISKTPSEKSQFGLVL